MDGEQGTQTLPISKNISDVLGAIQNQVSSATTQYNKLTEVQKQQIGEKIMADIMTPTIPMMMGGGGGGDGLFGGGAGGGGLIGGLILGSLLRQGNGGLFGGSDGAVGGAVLRNPPEQNQANMDLMAGIGGVDKAVAVSTATMEASQAAQTAALIGAVNGVVSPITTNVNAVKDAVNTNAMVLSQQLNGVNTNVMTTANETQKVVNADGDKTRALITQQYEMNLQRQLADANAALVELRNNANVVAATRGVEVTTTNNINQMQQQQQQQAQYGQLANLIWSLGQSIQNNNAAINVGSGTQTSTPTNTNTNIR